jgi:hypothetical protein
MGPPGCGKSFLGNHLSELGVVSYVELEPILVEKFGTGPEFAANKPRAIDFIRQSYREQLADRSRVVAFESTGVTDRPHLEDLLRCHRVALVKVATAKPICLQRIAERARGRNISNDIVASDRFYYFWRDEVAPTYAFALEVKGDDVDGATNMIRRYLQDGAAPRGRTAA